MATSRRVSVYSRDGASHTPLCAASPPGRTATFPVTAVVSALFEEEIDGDFLLLAGQASGTRR
jgi:hypothetical protein